MEEDLEADRASLYEYNRTGASGEESGGVAKERERGQLVAEVVGLSLKKEGRIRLRYREIVVQHVGLIYRAMGM